MDKYRDMIDMPRHVSARHPQMSIHDRAAQFAPFAALTGYDDAVSDAAVRHKEGIEQEVSYIAEDYDV